MKIEKAQRQQTKIKLGIQGPSGSGKTYSSLLLAKGLVQDWSKICVIDTENGSSNLYSHLGSFRVLKLFQPHSPESYTKAIQLAVNSGVKCIIIDSISHSWEYLTRYHASLPGNSFTNWSKVTPRHDAFVSSILHSDVHAIATMRTKQDYVLNLKDGKYVPEKVGLKAVQRDGIDYELTTVFNIDRKHFCCVSKDRTGLFIDNSEYDSFLIKEEHGKMILDWTCEGTDLKSEIMKCTTMEGLNDLYKNYRPTSKEVNNLFSVQKKILQSKMMSNNGQP